MEPNPQQIPHQPSSSEPGAPPQRTLPYAPIFQPSRPPNNSRNLLLGVGIVFVAFVVLFVLYIHSHQTTSVASGPSAYSLQQTVGNTWVMTVTNTRTTQGRGYESSALGAGEIYLAIEVTVQNMTLMTQEFLGYSRFSMTDIAGKSYLPKDLLSQNPFVDTVLQPGLTGEGSVDFEVPASTHDFTLMYASDGDSAKWILTV